MRRIVKPIFESMIDAIFKEASQVPKEELRGICCELEKISVKLENRLDKLKLLLSDMSEESKMEAIENLDDSSLTKTVKVTQGQRLDLIQKPIGSVTSNSEEAPNAKSKNTRSRRQRRPKRSAS